jgi:transposase
MDAYKNVNVEWRIGQPPVFKLFDRGQEIRKIDLDAYDDKDKLNKLLISLGFSRRNSQELEDHLAEKRKLKEEEDLLEMERQKQRAIEWKERQKQGELIRKKEAEELRRKAAAKERSNEL